MSEEHEGSIFIFIPEHILLNENLTAIDRMVFGLIVGLTKKKGYCYASNGWISKLLNISERSITRSITKLEELQLLVRQTIRTDGGQVVERRLYLFVQGGIDSPVTRVSPHSHQGIDTQSPGYRHSGEGIVKSNLVSKDTKNTNNKEVSLPLEEFGNPSDSGTDYDSWEPLVIVGEGGAAKKTHSNKTHSNKKNATLASSLEKYNLIIGHYNEQYGTKFKQYELTPENSEVVKKKISNVAACLTVYSPEEICQAIDNIQLDEYWADKMTPDILFRQMNPNREPVDYVGKMLELSTKKKPGPKKSATVMSEIPFSKVGFEGIDYDTPSILDTTVNW